MDTHDARTVTTNFILVTELIILKPKRFSDGTENYENTKKVPKRFFCNGIAIVLMPKKIRQWYKVPIPVQNYQSIKFHSVVQLWRIAYKNLSLISNKLISCSFDSWYHVLRKLFIKLSNSKMWTKLFNLIYSRRRQDTLFSMERNTRAYTYAGSY